VNFAARPQHKGLADPRPVSRSASPFRSRTPAIAPLPH